MRVKITSGRWWYEDLVGEVFTVNSYDESYEDASLDYTSKAYQVMYDGEISFILAEDCVETDQRTLELTANDIRWQPDKVLDLLANLARRVTSLERQLSDTQRNIETFAEQTENNSEDIRLLDERTQVIDSIQRHYNGGAR